MEKHKKEGKKSVEFGDRQGKEKDRVKKLSDRGTGV